MPQFAPDETDELIEYISSKYGWAGGIQDYEEQADGTVIVAVTDVEFDPHGSTDDEETLKAFVKAVNDGDVFGICHYDRTGGQAMDCLWGMAGYGGAKKAIQAYKEDHYDPAAGQRVYGEPVTYNKPPAPAQSVPTPPPVRLSQPGEELSRDEDRFIGWMLQHGWYDKRSDAIAHIERMRRSGTRIPGALSGVQRPSLWNWERLGR